MIMVSGDWELVYKFQAGPRLEFLLKTGLLFFDGFWARVLQVLLRSRHIRIRWWGRQVFWRVEDSFVTLVSRPVSGATSPVSGNRRVVRDTAILIQGKNIPDRDFTLTSLKSYRSTFPDVPLILSTWVGSDKSFLSEARAMGCEVVLNETENLPTGISNSNLQMLSTRSGILRAKDLGLENVLKTRTDQRIYNKLALHGLHAFSDLFPLTGVPPENQKKRLVFSSMNTFLYRPYSLSDMLMFGGVDDLLNYWTGNLDEREVSEPASTQREWAMRRMAEVWFSGGFLENRGENLDWSLAQYWEQLRLRFLVVDAVFFDVYWPKYSSLENRRSPYGDVNLFEEISHAHWLEIFNGNLVPNEALADVSFS